MLAVSVSTASFAATVNVLQGQVLLSRGQGYQLVDGATEAEPGATVVVNPGGIAQIVYPDGCMVQVQPPAVVAIAPQSPCQTQQPPTDGQQATDGTTVGYGTVAVGAVVVGGGIAAAFILLKQKDKPASP